ncbi:uncharacterized protein [Branchiostoma lanceolatum]|uniref:uncharacterized protein n=1 Tax=Branchiostoma lanceolatum TaxID=7740 RepID=UPI0034538DF6
MSDYDDWSSEESDDEEESANRLGKLVSAEEYRAFVNEVTLENDFLEITADGKELDLVTLGLSSTCLVIGKDNCDIYSGDTSMCGGPDPSSPYVGTFELKRILFLEQVRLTVHEAWRSQLKLELPNGKNYYYQLHQEMGHFLVWKKWQDLVSTLETDFPAYRAEYLRIKRQGTRERREETWKSRYRLSGDGSGEGHDTDEEERTAGTKRITTAELYAEISNPNVRSDVTSGLDPSRLQINEPIACSTTASSFTNVTTRSEDSDGLDESDDDVEDWNLSASSDDSVGDVSLGPSDQELGRLPPKYLTLRVRSLFEKTNLEFHRHGDTRLCRAASLCGISEQDGDETWSELAGVTRSSLLRYSSLPDILEGQAGFLWQRSRVVVREMTVNGHHVEMTPEEVSLLREVMTLRRTPADLDILVITDFTSGQSGQVVRVTRSVGNLGRHLENVTFLNTPSSGNVEKRLPDNQMKEDFSIDDVFQKYLVQHPETSPKKQKTDRRKSFAAAFNSILHSPKAKSPSSKKKGHNRQEKSSKEHSGNKKPSSLSPSPMAEKTRRKSMAQTLAKPFVKLKKSSSKRLHKRDASQSEVSEEVSYAVNDDQTLDLPNSTEVRKLLLLQV